MSLAPAMQGQQRLAHELFAALMWAFSRPGLPVDLPVGGLDALGQSLLDQQCSFYSPDADLALRLGQSGAMPQSPEQADYVFANLRSPQDLDLLGRIRTGDLLYPDRSATVFTTGRFDTGTALRLSGPGIAAELHIAIEGIDPGFWTIRERLTRYPLGLDLYIADERRLVGLPRSTKIEVL